MGKLMIAYNAIIISQTVIVSVWLLMHLKIPVNSQMMCHTITILFMITSVALETILT